MPLLAIGQEGGLGGGGGAAWNRWDQTQSSRVWFGSPTGFVILGKSLNFSDLQFLHLKIIEDK